MRKILQKKLLKKFLLLFVIALLIPLLPFFLFGELPVKDWLQADSGSSLALAVSGTLLLTLDALLPLPSSIVGTIMAGNLGFASGWRWISVGLMLSNLLAYYLGYLYPPKLRVSLPKVPVTLLLFLSRPVPVLAEASTFAAGAGKVNFKSFFKACLAGNLVYSFVLSVNATMSYNWFGSAWVGPALVLPMVLPALCWWLWKRYFSATGVAASTVKT